MYAYVTFAVYCFLWFVKIVQTEMLSKMLQNLPNLQVLVTSPSRTFPLARARARSLIARARMQPVLHVAGAPTSHKPLRHGHARQIRGRRN
jgi:hypothetical protein